MKFVFCLVAALCLSRITAQKIKPLSVGDIVPDIQLSHLIHSPGNNSKLSDFKSPVLLLDFWASWCSACVGNFGKLDQLQEMHPGQFKTLLINTKSTGDTVANIQNLLTKLRGLTGNHLNVPSLANDTLFDQLFPHEFVPHYVWLDASFRVIGITGSEAVTEQNVAALLKGERPSFITKVDNRSFDAKQPLFFNNNGGPDRFMFRSLITDYARGVGSGSFIKRDSTGLVTRISITNTPLLFLLKQAYQSDFPVRRMVISKSVPLDIQFRANDMSWEIKNSYCYELAIPPVPLAKAYEYMQQDLQRYFGLLGSFVKEPTDCYVLTADSSASLLAKTKGGKFSNHIFDPFDKELINGPVSTLALYLNNRLDLPVVNETQITYNIDLVLPDKKELSIPELQLVLAKYGLHIAIEKRTVEQFFITSPTNAKKP